MSDHKIQAEQAAAALELVRTAEHQAKQTYAAVVDLRLRIRAAGEPWLRKESLSELMRKTDEMIEALTTPR